MPKPSLPSGTRDFGPETVRKRNYILNTIRGVFELYGFQPLETPAMENLDTLMGKYGEEGDKLIFKILNNGLDDPNKKEKTQVAFEKVLEGKNTPDLTERALKYDLTIPFARYVAMNHGQLTFPFRRYQIQPVWRADRPQKGRYREFTQCDVDVVGSYSLLNEVELAGVYHSVLTRLGLYGYELRVNSRKILAALAEVCGGADKLTEITVAIDKLDKIGLDKVKEELSSRGLTAAQVETISQYLSIEGNNTEQIQQATALLGQTALGKKGLEEISFLMDHLYPSAGNIPGNAPAPIGAGPNIVIDFTLARGLNYYTGLIFEVKAPPGVSIGSLGGGGRYDDLTGLFGVPNVPGVGISFGVDRIYDVLEELKLFPDNVYTGTQVLFFNMGAQESKTALSLLQQLRGIGVRSEIYHESAKMDKQFKYAEKRNIPFIVIIGSSELEQNTCVIKNLAKGEQQTVSQETLVRFPF
jgi:histidyl-tRNA synthetase